MISRVRRFWVLGVAALIAAGPVHAADVVIAEIGSMTVTDRELKEALAMLPKRASAEILQPENRRKFIENFISWKLLVSEAERRKIHETEEYAKRIEQAKNDILLVLLQDALRSELPASDKDIKAFYQAHQKEFEIPEKRRARHILVSDEKKAREILTRLKAGAKFESEAKLHSEDPGSAAEGGDIGFRTRSEIVPEFAKELFSMKAGELLDRPVKTRFGWHLLRLEAITSGGDPKWSEIKDEVRMRYLQENGASAIPELTRSLREKTKIKIHEDRLSTLSVP